MFPSSQRRRSPSSLCPSIPGMFVPNTNRPLPTDWKGNKILKRCCPESSPFQFFIITHAGSQRSGSPYAGADADEAMGGDSACSSLAVALKPHPSNSSSSPTLVPNAQENLDADEATGGDSACSSLAAALKYHPSNSSSSPTLVPNAQAPDTRGRCFQALKLHVLWFLNYPKRKDPSILTGLPACTKVILTGLATCTKVVSIASPRSIIIC